MHHGPSRYIDVRANWYQFWKIGTGDYRIYDGSCEPLTPRLSAFCTFMTFYNCLNGWMRVCAGWGRGGWNVRLTNANSTSICADIVLFRWIEVWRMQWGAECVAHNTCNNGNRIYFIDHTPFVGQAVETVHHAMHLCSICARRNLILCGNMMQNHTA